MRARELKKAKDTKIHDMYVKAYCDAIEQYYEANNDADKKAALIKFIVAAVKAINSKKDPEYINREDAEFDFQFAAIVKDLMATLTPNEFMKVYPIDKVYNGSRYSMKDYFSTMNYINGLDRDKSIGKEILNFLWEYQNLEICDFVVETMGYISRLRRLDGEPSIAEEFADIMGLKIYTRGKDNNGREYLIDSETGKTIRTRKPMPRYLKVIK